MTHWELWKRLKLDHTDRWYMYKSEPVQEKESHKNSLGSWEINGSRNHGQKTKLRVNKRDKKRIWHPADFVVSKSENERKSNAWKLPRSCQRVEKTLEYKRDGDTNCSWCTLNGSQRPEKETRGLETIHTAPESTRIPRRVPEIEGTYCHLDSCKKPPVKTGVKDLHRSIIIIIIKDVPKQWKKNSTND